MSNIGTIRTAIQIYDGMTPAFKGMNNAMNIVLSSFEAVQNASSRAIDTNSIQAARAELVRAETSFNQIENEIRQADTAQQKFNNDVRNGQGAAAGLLSGFKNLAISMGLTLGAKSIIETSDTMALMPARLDLMNDKLQTTAQLQDMIYQSAQRSRSSYIDTGTAITKLGLLAGDAFSSNQEIVAFAEQMNKQFKIGPTGIQEQTAAMYQLTQAMAAGKLQGDEFRSIQENAPLLAKSIETYMQNAGVQGTLKDWSADGLITADVIKKAMFAVADETNERFEKLPMTWAQVWTVTTNRIIRATEPVLKFINVLANNWEMVAPVLLIVADALAVYAVAAYGGAAATAALNTARVFAVPIVALFSGATMAATAEQWRLNAAMYACPIVWIIAGIIALIALLYLGVAAYNRLADKAYSATGIIAGAIAANIAIVYNNFSALRNFLVDIVVAVYNIFAYLAEFLANVFNDPLGSIVRGFAGMADTVLQIIQSIASAIDTVFGSNLTFSVQSWRAELSSKVNSTVGEAAVKRDRIDPTTMHWSRLNIEEAYRKGYTWGEGMANKISGISDDLYNNIADIASNTGSMADSLAITEEDLKYLRDVAEQEVINRFTTAEINMTVANHNNISNDMDIDGVVSKMEQKLYEKMTVAAEGVYS